MSIERSEVERFAVSFLGSHRPSCKCSRRGATREYRRVLLYLCTAQNCFRTRIWCRMRQEWAEARLQPVPFDDGRSVVSRCAVDRGPSISVHQLRLDVATPVVTSWVSMEHWLRGSQVSKARPGAPFACFRRGAFRRSCTG
jgi:hypothetical protein